MFKVASELTPLHIACEMGQTTEVEKLLQNGADMQLHSSQFFWTPLHWTARCGSVECTRLLLRWGADVNDVDITQRTPLHWVAQNGFLEMLQVLLDSGANANATDCLRCTPLHAAAMGPRALRWDVSLRRKVIKNVPRNYLGCIEALLLHGADLNAPGLSNKPPLLMAAQKGHAKAVLLLLDSGATLAASVDKGNLLHFACRSGDLDTIEIVLATGAFDLQCRAGDGSTPLHLAACRKKPTECVKALVCRGANVHARNGSGRTPLHLAASHNCPESVDMLLDLGADVAARDDSGDTPLHLAVCNWTAKKCVEVLLERGADVHARNRKKRTPLHVAAKHDCPESIHVLVRTGARVAARDNSGKTPLHLAASHNKRSCMRALLRWRAPVHTRDARGRTPLHYATMSLLSRRECTRMLLEAGANRLAADHDDWTPLDFAIVYNSEMADFLRTWALAG